MESDTKESGEILLILVLGAVLIHRAASGSWIWQTGLGSLKGIGQPKRLLLPAGRTPPPRNPLGAVGGSQILWEARSREEETVRLLVP